MPRRRLIARRWQVDSSLLQFNCLSAKEKAVIFRRREPSNGEGPSPGDGSRSQGDPACKDEIKREISVFPPANQSFILFASLLSCRVSWLISISCYEASVSDGSRPQDLKANAFFFKYYYSLSDLEAAPTADSSSKFNHQMGWARRKRLRLKEERQHGESEEGKTGIKLVLIDSRSKKRWAVGLLDPWKKEQKR